MSDAPFQGVIEYLRRTVAAQPGTGVSDAQLLDRFVANKDEAAFELLVWRHGKMVMGTCQRVLRDPHEAEDAFQACFLVLARRAGSINRRQSIGAWLYQVASRVALHCRTRGSRLRIREWPVEDGPAAGKESDPVLVAGWKEVRPLLDEAIRHLPERFRAPFVLRHLEGWSNRQIAEELGCSEGTVESRLCRAKERMRTRLSRRGVTLGGGFLAFTIGDQAASAAVTKVLVLKTTHSAMQFAGLSAGAAALSPPIVLLARGAMQSMLVANVKFVGSFVLVGTLACGTAGFTAYRSLAFGPSGAESLVAADPTAEYPNGEDGAKPITAAQREELLAPKLVHLTYKDTPLREALADFKRQSGYDLAFTDPGNRLKGRKITLDTGKVTFWKALALFCEKGELMDNADVSGTRASSAFSGGGADVVEFGAVGQFATTSSSASRGQSAKRILLSDGVPTPVAAFVDGAVRVRVAAHPEGPERPAGPALAIPLKVVPEPRIQWIRTLGIQLDKAIDDQGQSLVEAARKAKPEQIIPGQAIAIAGGAQVNAVRTFAADSFSDASLKILLNKGEKPTTKLKEISGKVRAQVMGPSTALITVTDVLDSAGKIGKTTDGGSLELLEAGKSDDGKIVVRFILDTPVAAGVAGVAGVPGVAAVGQLRAAAAAPPVNVVDIVVDPAAAQPPVAVAAMPAQVVMLRQGVSMLSTTAPNQEFKLMDDRGNVIPLVGTSLQSVTGKPSARQYQLTFDGSRSPGTPSKLLYTSRSPLTVEIPFTLRDVDLSARAGEDQGPEE